MKRKICLRCLMGAPIGLTISIAITFVISLCLGDGLYHAVTPDLAADVGGELRAVLLQFAFSLLYGAAFGQHNVNIDEIIKQIPLTTDEAELIDLYTKLTEIYLTEVPSFSLPPSKLIPSILTP